MSGATSRNRTNDLLITSQLLYQLSYGGLCVRTLVFIVISIGHSKKDCKNSHNFELFNYLLYFFSNYYSFPLIIHKSQPSVVFLSFILQTMYFKKLKPFIVILISIVALLLLWKNLNNTSSWPSDLFALKDPNKITKFKFTPNNDKVQPLEFEKIDGIWFIKTENQSYPADSHNVSMLLNWAMPKLRIKMPIPNESKEYVNRQLALEGIKASFYEGEKEVHTIYVGGPTQDQMATYMFAPETERPCIVEIPSFQGYLTPYFNTDPQLWRTIKLINANPSDILSLKVIWHSAENESFEIKQENNNLKLFDLHGKEIEAKKGLLTGYLLMCREFTREAGGIPGINKIPQKRDSIIQSLPILTFKYTLRNAETPQSKPSQLTISIYPNYHFEDVGIEASPSDTKTVQTALFWVKSSDDPNLWLTQDVVIKNRLKSLSEFKSLSKTNN
jgi:hypothetical protein